jgi:hypothetical protein
MGARTISRSEFFNSITKSQATVSSVDVHLQSQCLSSVSYSQINFKTIYIYTTNEVLLDNLRNSLAYK